MKQKKIRTRWIILAVMLIYCWLTMAVSGMGEWYARHLYRWISAVLSWISYWTLFSLDDIFIYGSIAGIIIYCIYAHIKHLNWKHTLGRTVEYLLWVYAWFYIGWGLNYFREDFYSRTHTPKIEYTETQYNQFLRTYTDSLNASFVEVNTINRDLVATKVKESYKKMADRLGLIKPASNLHAKPMLLTSFMSGVGVLGYMGPFFNEYNLNTNLLPVQYPFTYAHEMAHLLGTSSEGEANLYGFLVCTHSDVKEMRFSGYLSLLPYVMKSAKQHLKEKQYNDWKATLSPQVKKAYNQKRAYWDQLYNPLIGKAQDTLYNWFLKGNQVKDGSNNYANVITLLINIKNAGYI